MEESEERNRLGSVGVEASITWYKAVLKENGKGAWNKLMLLTMAEKILDVV